MIATHAPLTLPDLHLARSLYGGTIVAVAPGTFRLVGAVVAGTRCTFGPVTA